MGVLGRLVRSDGVKTYRVILNVRVVNWGISTGTREVQSCIGVVNLYPHLYVR